MKQYGTEMKCKHCGEIKSINEFSYKGKFYHQKVCKACFKTAFPSQIYIKKGRKINKDSEEKARKYNDANPFVWTVVPTIQATPTYN